MDKEQLQLGSSDKFWKLITQRRTQRTISRTALELRLSKDDQVEAGFKKGNVHNHT